VDARETRGVILGRFMPPHAGHRYLIDFGRFSSDRLSLLLCSLPDEPIPGDLREQWLRELFPSVELYHIKEAIPEASRGSPNAVRIWADTIRDVVGQPIDWVFASEEYGFELAHHLEGTFVPVDPARETFPVSATAIREDPYGYWSYLPAPVRAYYAKRICVVQQEGEGLAARLAREFDTVTAPDYAAFVRHLYGRQLEEGEHRFVASGQRASEEALARRANRLLFSVAEPGSVLWRAGHGSHTDPVYDILLVSAASTSALDRQELARRFGVEVLFLSEQHARELGDARHAVQQLLGH
jgi:NadR type nicotinamide-nucleotide adenylyltransferase